MDAVNVAAAVKRSAAKDQRVAAPDLGERRGQDVLEQVRMGLGSNGLQVEGDDLNECVHFGVNRAFFQELLAGLSVDGGVERLAQVGCVMSENAGLGEAALPHGLVVRIAAVLGETHGEAVGPIGDSVGEQSDLAGFFRWRPGKRSRKA
jgi:hypothetical protein